MTDVTVTNCGSVFTLTPETEAATEWVTENLALESWQWFGNSVVVDARFAGDIVNGMQEDGLEVR